MLFIFNAITSGFHPPPPSHCRKLETVKRAMRIHKLLSVVSLHVGLSYNTHIQPAYTYTMYSATSMYETCKHNSCNQINPRKNSQEKTPDLTDLTPVPPWSLSEVSKSTPRNNDNFRIPVLSPPLVVTALSQPVAVSQSWLM